MSIPLMRSTFIAEQETLSALADWLTSKPRRLSMGEQCAHFEYSFAHWQGRKHAVLFNSGASANLAILQSLLNLGRLHAGDKVGFSALTWATNVMPIIQLGLTPVPLDIAHNTLNVMSDSAMPALTTLDALFITNALGYLPDLDRIKELCDLHEVILLEDNCESLGSELPAGKSGNFGLCASFSFFVAHHMSTIEGGMVATDDSEFAEMLVMVRANGWDRNLPTEAQFAKRKATWVSDFEAAYTFYTLGYNMRPTEITGFLGNCQLKHLELNLERRLYHYLALEAAAADNYDFAPLNRRHMSRFAPFAYPVICHTRQLRDSYIQRFQAAGVEVRPIIAGNITRQPFYTDRYLPVHLPITDAVATRGFYFGLYSELTAADITLLSSLLRMETDHASI